MCAEHSPLPWMFDGTFLDVIDADGCTVVEGNGVPADSALIVRAVNAHGELLAIVRQLAYTVPSDQIDVVRLVRDAKALVSKLEATHVR